MSAEGAAQVYDFACFLQARRSSSRPVDQTDDGWLQDTEEQMQAEDALWEATRVRHSDGFAALADTARAEIRAAPRVAPAAATAEVTSP
jgi:hypothetical protein